MLVDKVWNCIQPPDFYTSPSYADVYIIASDGEVKAHRLILGASCELFRLCLLDNQLQLSDQVPFVYMPDYTTSFMALTTQFPPPVTIEQLLSWQNADLT
jgi:hypothetical protein